MMRRKVTEQDLVAGATIYSKYNVALNIIEVRESCDTIHYDNNCYDYISDIVGRYEIEDKPTGIPTFGGQIGGTHYAKNDPIQFAKDNFPPEQLEGFYRINAIKYVARYDKKNGIEDIKKAKHYIEMLLELKEQQNAK